MAKDTRITTLGVLRGFAVLAVCFCHLAKPLTNDTIHINPLNIFFKYGVYGNYGVHVFFVISGFVIPYSLFKGDYKIIHYFKFLWKRILRLHPPYLMALILTLIISYFSYRIRHMPNPESVFTIVQSLFYLHFPTDNPVFWTLRIEAEYYIFIGLFFSVLTKFPKISLLLIIPVLLLLSQTQLINYIGLLKYIVFFLIGIIGFIIYTKIGTSHLEWSILFLLIVFSFVYYEFPATVFSILTISVILFLRKPVHSVLEWPGEISYSVYLIHFIIGTKLINLLSRRIDPYYNWELFILTSIVCLGLGWVFWKLIERPWAKLSNKVRYGNREVRFANFNIKA